MWLHSFLPRPNGSPTAVEDTGIGSHRSWSLALKSPSVGSGKVLGLNCLSEKEDMGQKISEAICQYSWVVEYFSKIFPPSTTE